MRLHALHAALTAALLLATASPALAAEPLDQASMLKLLRELDERQRNTGDYKAVALIDQKRQGKEELVYQAAIYRRDAKDKMVILFLKPKSEAGKGYLRINKNLLMYDPSVGKWERRTERESIGGTTSRRRDFDASSFADEYTPTYVKQEALGRFQVHHMRLKVKAGKDVAYPVVDIWVDTKTQNLLKIQEFALSGKLMRTSYYPKWSRHELPKDRQKPGKTHVYVPQQIRIFDEVEKGNQTTIVTMSVELQTLPDTIFSKGWLESKSR